MEQVAARGAVQARVAHRRTHDGEALPGLRVGQAAHVHDLAVDAAQAVVFQADHVGQLVELVDHAQVLEERLDLGQRHAVDRSRLARARLHRHAVQVGQAEDVARIDQVRVLDLRVGLPDFRPQPRPLEEAPGDVPQRVAVLDDVGVRMVAAQLHGGGIGRDGQQRDGAILVRMRAVRLTFGRRPFDARSSIAAIYPLPLEISPYCRGNIAHKRRVLASPRRYNRPLRRGGVRRCDRRPRFRRTPTAMAQLPILEFPDPRLRTKAAASTSAGWSGRDPAPDRRHVRDHVRSPGHRPGREPGRRAPALHGDRRLRGQEPAAGVRQSGDPASSRRAGLPGRLPVGPGHLRRRHARRHASPSRRSTATARRSSCESTACSRSASSTRWTTWTASCSSITSRRSSARWCARSSPSSASRRTRPDRAARGRVTSKRMLP